MGTLLIAYKIGSTDKFEKTFQQRKANCVRTMTKDIPELKHQFLEKYDLDIYNSDLSVKDVIKEFCFSNQMKHLLLPKNKFAINLLRPNLLRD